MNCSVLLIGWMRTMHMDTAIPIICKHCGSQKLTPFRKYTQITYYHYLLPCTCGNQYEFAAVRTGHITRAYEEWGYFKDNTWTVKDTKRVGPQDRRVDGSDILCHRCYEIADDSSWQYTESMHEEFNSDYCVRCKNCHHEMKL